jgi:hypothetical protein
LAWPAWLDAPYQQMRKPARLIRLDKHKLQNLGVETHQHLYRLTDQLPKAVLDGGEVHESKPDTPLVVVEAPELTATCPFWLWVFGFFR